MSNLSNILDMLKAEAPTHEGGGHRPKGQICKFCSTALAVTRDQPTIVHKRNWIADAVSVETLYNGKYFCRMCHRYQA